MEERNIHCGDCGFYTVICSYVGYGVLQMLQSVFIYSLSSEIIEFKNSFFSKNATALLTYCRCFDGR